MDLGIKINLKKQFQNNGIFAHRATILSVSHAILQGNYQSGLHAIRLLILLDPQRNKKPEIILVDDDSVVK